MRNKTSLIATCRNTIKLYLIYYDGQRYVKIKKNIIITCELKLGESSCKLRY